MSYTWQAGVTDVTTYWRAFDTAGGDYAGAEIAHNATGLTLAYFRYKTAAVSAVTGGGTAPVDLANAGATHTDWGWCQVIGPFYRADFPDAAFASGVPLAGLAVYGVSGVVFTQVTLSDILASDPRAADLTAADISAQINADVPDVNVKTMNGATVNGNGTSGNLWRGA